MKKVVRCDEEWRKRLTAEQYRVLCGRGTEPPFGNKYANHKEKGTYLCAGCNAKLFDSLDKFDSGTGWPSFNKPVSKDAVETEEDFALAMPRIEVHCTHCGGHLGHVFGDGPAPAGKRYCINSASLGFEPAGSSKTQQ